MSPGNDREGRLQVRQGGQELESQQGAGKLITGSCGCQNLPKVKGRELMENLWKDEQDKDAESKVCCTKCKSFSPNSAARAGNRQPLLGALGRSWCPASAPSKGTGPAPRAEEVPELWEGSHTFSCSRGVPEQSCFAPPGVNGTISRPPNSSDDRSPGGGWGDYQHIPSASDRRASAAWISGALPAALRGLS